ncbi:MAG: aminodeoxychorismate lyase, partial [Campylobacteraceae bacterium]|nr:aminodeoxychorismate lyase [Campylobacteraceae bacterium]
QMDGTLNYGYFGNTKVTPERIRTDISSYNTYKYAGLPPQPISTVSKDAILAAIFPAQSDYLYFVRNKTGSHTFSKTYEAHLKAIAKNR